MVGVERGMKISYAQIAREQKTHAVKDMNISEGSKSGYFHGKSLCGMLANWDAVVSGPATCKTCKEVEQRRVR